MKKIVVGALCIFLSACGGSGGGSSNQSSTTTSSSLPDLGTGTPRAVFTLAECGHAFCVLRPCPDGFICLQDGAFDCPEGQEARCIQFDDLTGPCLKYGVALRYAIANQGTGSIKEPLTLIHLNTGSGDVIATSMPFGIKHQDGVTYFTPGASTFSNNEVFIHTPNGEPLPQFTLRFQVSMIGDTRQNFASVTVQPR